jgi:hypothetical protein
MILAYLSIKDLTRSLAVSKHWYATILGSLALRRILFLEPDHIRSEYLHVAWGTRECRATLIREARDEHSLTIVEAHPVLKIISDDPRRIVRSSVHTDRILCSSLQAVHPSTLLFQPPGETVYATLIPGQMGRGRKSYLRRFVVERTGGVTFGALLTEMETIYDGKLSRTDEDICNFYIESAMETSAGALKNAREALAEAQRKEQTTGSPDELLTGLGDA